MNTQDSTKIAAALFLAGGLAYTQYRLLSKPSTPVETYHIGIETGGTSCKVGIMKSSDSLKIYKHHVVQTTTPAETI